MEGRDQRGAAVVQHYVEMVGGERVIGEDVPINLILDVLAYAAHDMGQDPETTIAAVGASLNLET